MRKQSMDAAIWASILKKDAAQHKGSVGEFEFWLAGPQRWEVRRAGKVVARATDLNKASRLAQHFNDQLKAGDPHGIIAEL